MGEHDDGSTTDVSHMVLTIVIMSLGLGLASMAFLGELVVWVFAGAKRRDAVKKVQANLNTIQQRAKAENVCLKSLPETATSSGEPIGAKSDILAGENIENEIANGIQFQNQIESNQGPRAPKSNIPKYCKEVLKRKQSKVSIDLVIESINADHPEWQGLKT